MALWKFTNLNKYGNPRSRIIYRPDGEAFSINPRGFGPFINVRMFRYEYKHEMIPPSLIELNGKKFIVPTWQEVDPNTQLKDIEWIKPKKKRTEPIIEMHVSSSKPDIEYKTTYYPDSGKFYCYCPGRWRAFDGKCKHIKELEKKINK